MGWPDTAPGKIGPPNWDKSTDVIAVISNCSPCQKPAPTKTSPVLPSESTTPLRSNIPTWASISKFVIVSWKIINVDSPVSLISTTKWGSIGQSFKSHTSESSQQNNESSQPHW